MIWSWRRSKSPIAFFQETFSRKNLPITCFLD